MELIYEGKTKDVFRLENGNIKLKFKDDVTGEKGMFDPGANKVGLTVKGAGKSALKMTKYFFELLQEKNIPTHYIKANMEEVSMTVKDALMFGKGLEVICRRSEEHTSELQSRGHLVCRLLLEKKKQHNRHLLAQGY